MIHALLCFLVGLGAVVGAVGLFHAWTRLWHRLIFGSWRFDHRGSDDDCFHSHLAVLIFTVTAVFVCLALYVLGCALRQALGI